MLGDVIQTIAQDYGEKALLDARFTLSKVSELAPGMEEQKELLRVFLLCNGASAFLRVRTSPVREQEECMENLVRRMQEEHWVPEEPARAVCAEFYRGITGCEWGTGSRNTETKNPEEDLDVYHIVTIRDSERTAEKLILVDIGDRVVDVMLPAHVSNGQTLCFPERGRRGVASGKTGDLYVTVQVLKKSPGKPWLLPAAAAAAVVLLVGVLLLGKLVHRHDWKDATCESPKICERCGETKGSPQGHSWTEATCANPKTCTVCGQTSGSALGHDWENATCTHPEVCRICGTVGSNTSGHQWQDATRLSPRRCSACGITDGISLGTPVTDCVLLEDTQAESKRDILFGTMYDVSNVRYEDAMAFWVRADGNYNPVEHIVYQLSGDYDLLKGVIALSRDGVKHQAVRFYIYGDGDLLYKSAYISGSDCETFELDVTGVQELKIKCETKESGNCYGLIQATLHVQ